MQLTALSVCVVYVNIVLKNTEKFTLNLKNDRNQEIKYFKTVSGGKREREWEKLKVQKLIIFMFCYVILFNWKILLETNSKEVYKEKKFRIKKNRNITFTNVAQMELMLHLAPSPYSKIPSISHFTSWTTQCIFKIFTNLNFYEKTQNSKNLKWMIHPQQRYFQ